MKIHLISAFLVFSFFIAVGQSGQPLTDSIINSEMPYLKTLYLHLHQNPELSLQEKNTSARMAEELQKAGFEVTEHVGGYGVVGILKNGEGPTVLVRTDMDALPVTEETGKPYESHVRSVDVNGKEVGVMHACGHDIHMSIWTGTAGLMGKMKKNWQGTLVFIGQPAEEMGLGSKAMIDDGLFDLIPRPDYNLALHDDPQLKAGTIGICNGYAMANVDMVDIVVHGIGGHGAIPEMTIDPVLIAAKIILNLQTIVSREISPFNPVVITVGKIEGGTVGNVIPSRVKLELTVRTFGDETRREVLEKIRRTSKGTAISAGVPDTLYPDVIVRDQFTPSLYNDPQLSDRIFKALTSCLGENNVFHVKPITAGEDFSRYGRQTPPIPSLLFWLGAVSQSDYERSKKGEITLPSLHSSKFAPDYPRTIKTGVKAMSCALLDLMNNR